MRTSSLVVFLVTMSGEVAEARSPKIPVIEPGRERDVVGLFQPFKPGGSVVSGWKLWDLSIRRTRIQVSVRGPGGQTVRFGLVHWGASAFWAERSASFAFILGEGADSGSGAAAVRRLIDAVKRNDVGGFWRVWRSRPTRPPRHGWFATWVLAAWAWITDGTLFLLFIAVVLIVLARRQLTNEPRWMKVTLPVVLVLGLILRLFISEDAAMGAWPYGRLTDTSRAVYHGPLLALMNRLLGGQIFLTAVVSHVTLVCAFLAPLGLFVHGRYLLDDARAALGSAALLALLPLHIRFSRSDVAFIPSIVLSNVSFVLLHAALVDRSRGLRWVAMALLPLTVLKTYALRPLNLFFLPLLLFAALYLLRKRAPAVRRHAAAGLLTAVSICFVAFSFLPEYAPNLRESLVMGTVVWTFKVIFSPTMNVLINRDMTPLPFVAMAVAGAVILWRSGKKPLAVFFVTWLLLFYFGHASTVPEEPEMQARYHLHLIVPFLLLASASLEPLYRHGRKAFFVVGVYAVLSPFFFLGFERDVAFTDMREFAFVRSTRKMIPERCTVLEYVGESWRTLEARYGRMGNYLENGRTQNRFNVKVTGYYGSGLLKSETELLLKNPPECVYLYEGVTCWAEKKKSEPIAPACAAMRRAAVLQPIRRITVQHRRYDSAAFSGTHPRQRRFTFTLYRVSPSAR